MRISRLYTPLALSSGKRVVLDDDSAHYVRSVLRLKPDDAITLFNGSGGEFQCVLMEVNRKIVALAVGDHSLRSVESPLQISLGLGISRGDRMDLAVQKAVELGVNSITPLITERCVVQFKGEKRPQRWQHWQHIVHHAAEQCGRSYLPVLSDITPIQDWVGQQSGLKIFLDPYAETLLTALQPEVQHVTLLSGPEGGFAAVERDVAKAAGFIPVRLGARILRTETAALAALSAVQLLWGDFGQCSD